MTSYKKPVWFDRDIKAFSELSDSADLDLGLVARSILAEAAVTVGQTGLDGSVSVKNASDAQTIGLYGASGGAVFGGPTNGWVTLKDGSNVQRINLNVSDSSIYIFDADENEAGLFKAAPDSGEIKIKAVDAGVAYQAQTRADASEVNTTYYVANQPIARIGKFGSTSLLEAGGSNFNSGLTLSNQYNGAGLNVQCTDTQSAMFLGTNDAPGRLSIRDENGDFRFEFFAIDKLLDLQAGLIQGLDTARITQPDHAATKQYVDSVAQGLDCKASVVTATSADITLSGLQTIDGVAVAEGARVLVKNQTDATQNGIYLASSGAWERSQDMNADAEFPGAFTFVEGGTLQGTGWVCTNDSVTLGTTAITFTQFSGAGTYVAGAGISITGTTIAAVVDGVHAIINGSNQIDVAGLPIGFTIDSFATSLNVSAKNLSTLVDGQSENATPLHSHFADCTKLALGPTQDGSLLEGKAVIMGSDGFPTLASTSSSGAWVLGIGGASTGVGAADPRIILIRSGLTGDILGGTATPGDVYYVQADGSIGTSLPSSGRCIMVGVAVSPYKLLVQIRDFGTLLAA